MYIQDKDIILSFIKKNLIFNIISILLFLISFLLFIIYLFTARVWTNSNNINVLEQILHIFWTINYYFMFFFIGMSIVPYINNYFISKNIKKEIMYNSIVHFLLFIPILSFIGSCYYLNYLNKINFNKNAKKSLNIKILYSFHAILFGLIFAAVSTLPLVYIFEWRFNGGKNTPAISLLLIVVIPIILCVTTFITFIVAIVFFIIRILLSFSYALKNNREPLSKKEKIWYIFFPYILNWNCLALFID